jgi:hypothetical protein
VPAVLLGGTSLSPRSFAENTSVAAWATGHGEKTGRQRNARKYAESPYLHFGAPVRHEQHRRTEITTKPER